MTCRPRPQEAQEHNDQAFGPYIFRHVSSNEMKRLHIYFRKDNNYDYQSPSFSDDHPAW